MKTLFRSRLIFLVLIALTACSTGEKSTFSAERSLYEEGADHSSSYIKEAAANSEIVEHEVKEDKVFSLENINYSLNTGILIADQPDAQINLRSDKTASSASKGYGLVGDLVELIDASWGIDSFEWYYVKFRNSGAEGWIRRDFIQVNQNPLSASELELISKWSGLTTEQVNTMLALDKNNYLGLNVKIIVPGYVPSDFHVSQFSAEDDSSFGPYYSIRYANQNGKCFAISGTSGGFGAVPLASDKIPITSLALGNVELEYTQFDEYSESPSLSLSGKGVIASVQEYDFVSPADNNCEIINTQEAIKIIGSLVYLNP